MLALLAEPGPLLASVAFTVVVVPGAEDNRKLTRPEDLLWAAGHLAARAAPREERC